VVKTEDGPAERMGWVFGLAITLLSLALPKVTIDDTLSQGSETSLSMSLPHLKRQNRRQKKQLREDRK
jgi:hypothetical protein